MTDLLAVTYGPLPLLTDALSAIPGIESAFIYGSWAARYQGRPGHPPADVDLLIVGTADPDAVQAAVEPSARRLRREVQVRHVRPEVWARPV
ncbi:MAG: ArsR family transcriptional regulator, partial [Actinobacteria bacterium]|nr:ArsR family transcriptional regulator [Actinomycetota bacterium]